MVLQEAQLSQRDRMLCYVSWNLINRCTTVPVQKYPYEKPCNRWNDLWVQVTLQVTQRWTIYHFLLIMV